MIFPSASDSPLSPHAIVLAFEVVLFLLFFLTCRVINIFCQFEIHLK